jgi:hypothetical protein
MPMGKLTKVAKKTHIIPLHTDTSRYKQTPGDGFGIEPYALEECHLMFFISCILGVVRDLVHRLGRVEAVFSGEMERCVCVTGGCSGVVRHDCGYRDAKPRLRDLKAWSSESFK